MFLSFLPPSAFRLPPSIISMSNTIIVGAQWGDEGKGKIIDVLAREADYIIRFQGGNNAGHTVVIGDQEFVLHLIPSGILHPGKVCVIGNGVVVDPQALCDEIESLQKRKITIGSNLKISDQSHLIFPYHKILDQLRETHLGKSKIGTTGRGIGPCYVDKMARCGIRLADLMEDEVFQEKLGDNIHEKNEVFQEVYGHPGFSYEEILESYQGYREKIKLYICDTVRLLNDAIAKKKNLLFEGAQGTLLDVDHGTYPYVTSSSATAGGACAGTGIGPSKIGRVIGVAKAYTTRVGEGPFPTEFDAAQMKRIRQKGNEFGATTGRPRRCGWFDAVLVRHAVLVNGLDEIIITKLDVLDEDQTIKICTSYQYQGKRYDRFPANGKILEECEPIYEEHPGWRQQTCEISSFKDLPINAKKYLRRLETVVGAPIKMVSVGSKREQIFSI